MCSQNKKICKWIIYMAVYEKGIETKRRFILSMYNKLRERDASTITVREIAKENNCSPAALYKHFESLEYLIVLGSIRFFIDYMIEYGQLMDNDDNLMDAYIQGWMLYNKYAFDRPDLFYRLFWGEYNTLFADALMEYYELFPVTGSERYPAYYYTLLFSDNVIERDFLILRRAANYNLLSDEDAEYFSKTNTLIVKGMLEMYMGRDLRERRQGEQECNQLLLKNLEKVYVLEKHRPEGEEG